MNGRPLAIPDGRVLLSVRLKAHFYLPVFNICRAFAVLQITTVSLSSRARLMLDIDCGLFLCPFCREVNFLTSHKPHGSHSDNLLRSATRLHRDLLTTSALLTKLMQNEHHQISLAPDSIQEAPRVPERDLRRSLLDSGQNDLRRYRQHLRDPSRGNIHQHHHQHGRR